MRRLILPLWQACSPHKGVHRTWDKILTQLLAHFEKEPEFNIGPATNLAFLFQCTRISHTEKVRVFAWGKEWEERVAFGVKRPSMMACGAVVEGNVFGLLQPTE